MSSATTTTRSEKDPGEEEAPSQEINPQLVGIAKTFSPSLLHTKIQSSKILVIGSGGIGCELLKTLALCGFMHVEVIDLDTVDVSNLNRQFLFRSNHVGMSKCEVGCEVARSMLPVMDGDDDVKYIPHHDNIFNASKFNVPYFKKFSLVLNALDNVDARRRVNRLALAASIPLIEAGTTGYVGQVTVIDKSSNVECYECQTKPTVKVYPICTIRSTPSKSVHCVVWAKEFWGLVWGEDVKRSMLFEEEQQDDDNADEEKEEEGKLKKGEKSTYMDIVFKLRGYLEDDEKKEQGDVTSKVKEIISELLIAIFSTEIQKQIDMDRYKTSDRKPQPLDSKAIHHIVMNTPTPSQNSFNTVTPPTERSDYHPTKLYPTLTDGISQITHTFLSYLFSSSSSPQSRLKSFDKDDTSAMNFVTASSNLRQSIFHITPIQSQYDAKGIAGNIIPAIATTNAIVAGLQVLNLLKILNQPEKQPDKTLDVKDCCKYTYVNRTSTRKGYNILPTTLPPPNPKCFVCRNATIHLSLSLCDWTLDRLLSRLIKQELGFHNPTLLLDGDLIHEEGQGAAEEFLGNLNKKLTDLPCGGVKDGVLMRVEDYDQDLEVDLCFVNKVDWDDDKEQEDRFFIGGERPVISYNKDDDKKGDTTSSSSSVPTTNSKDDDDDDIIMIVSDPNNPKKAANEHQEQANSNDNNKKRPLGDHDASTDSSNKRIKKSADDKDVTVIEID